MLSLKQLQDVCLLYSGNYKRCRYLAQDDIDTTKWYCAKKSLKSVEIDEEVSDFLRELKRKQIDPHKQGIPLGDNCEGYPVFKYIEQGYDK